MRDMMHAGRIGLLLVLTTAATLAVPTSAQQPLTVYVAPDGRDEWSGLLPAPNADGTEGPVASPQRALEQLRRARKTSTAPAAIVLRGGVYHLPAPLVLKAEDSGLTVRAQAGEQAVLSGGRIVTAWRPYQGEVLQADLGPLGLRADEFHELYVNGLRQPLARVPNFDPDHARIGGWLTNEETVEPGTKAKLRYREGTLDPTRWSHPERALLIFHDTLNWETHWLPLKLVDPAQRLLEGVPIPRCNAVEAGCPFYIANVFEELDAPGEWYADPDTQTLFLWPPAGGDDGGVVTVPAIESAIVVQGSVVGGPLAEDIRIEHIEIRDCRGPGISLSGARDCAVIGCGIRNVQLGVLLGDASHACRVAGNDITQTGVDGISTVTWTTDDHERVTDHVIDNNHIWDFGWGDISGRSSGVQLWSCARITVSHNLIHDGPRMGIGADIINDCVFAYNHCHHMNLTTADSGLFYAATAADWSRPVDEQVQRNRTVNSRNEFHHNLLHDSGGWGRQGSGSPFWYPYFTFGIYLDPQGCGWRIHHNVVYNTVHGAFASNAGLENVFENNICVDGRDYQLYLHPWTALPCPTSGNRIERNVFAYTARNARLYDVADFKDDYAVFERNLISAPGTPHLSLPGVPLADGWAEWMRAGRDAGSRLDDPQFVDPENADYRLRDTSPAFDLGFEQIDLSDVGLYDCPERHSPPGPEAPVLREPADYRSMPRVDLQPPCRDYEDYPVGAAERGANVQAPEGSAVEVSEEMAAEGRRSLKISEAGALQYPWEPYITYTVNWDEGVAQGGLDLCLQQGTVFEYAWRDDPAKYNLGPALRVDAQGMLTANGKQVGRLPVGEWVRLDVVCALGDRADGTYSLIVKVGRRPAQRFEGLACSPDFTWLNCVLIMSMGEGPGVFYLDNLDFRLGEE